MLPYKHFLIAGVVTAGAGIVLPPEKSVIEIIKWVLAGGILSSAVDLDVLVIVLLKSQREVRLRPFRSVFEMHRKYMLFMDTIFETGALRIAMKTHFIISGLMILLSYFFLHAYFVPVVLGVASHIISDLPHLQRVIRKGS